MITALAVAFAAVAQAASINWQNAGSRTAGTIYKADGTAIGSGAVAYLFDTATITQAALLEGLRSGADISSFTKVDTAVTASSKISATPAVTYGTAGDDVTMFYAIFDAVANKVLIADAVTKGIQASDVTTFAFSKSETWSKVDNAAASYGAAGWYDVVPEPTSGLMMLLGIGVLALRRRRA